MASRLSKWLKQRQDGKLAARIEDVQPLHPDEYPARRLKAMLDDRRSRMEELESQPTGILNDVPMT